MVVDLGRSRSVSSHVYEDFMNCRLPHELAGSLNTLPVPISRKDCPFMTFFFFCCIAELAIKPCRSSRSKLRGEFGIPRHLQNRKQKHNKATKKQQNKQKTKNRQVLECETRGEKRVKRPKRPNALICRTPGGSMRYP